MLVCFRLARRRSNARAYHFLAIITSIRSQISRPYPRLALKLVLRGDYVEGDEDGDIILINNPQDMPLLDSLDIDVYESVFSQHKPAKIEPDNATGGFAVDADLYKESQLIRAKIEISAKGRVKITEQKMIMHQMTGVNYNETAY